ncbi:MAG: hypothetical protein R3A11_09630 [Bdellovibrionota bacterium]
MGFAFIFIKMNAIVKHYENRTYRLMFHTLAIFLLMALLQGCGENQVEGRQGSGPVEMAPLSTPTGFSTAMDGST